MSVMSVISQETGVYVLNIDENKAQCFFGLFYNQHANVSMCIHGRVAKNVIVAFKI